MSKRILLTTAFVASLAAFPALAADATADSASDPVVARVNGHEIHRSDIAAQMQQMGPQAAQMPPQMIYPQLLQRMIATQIVAEKGYADKLQNDPAVKKEMKDAEAQFVAEAYVHKAVQPKITEAKVKERYDELAAKFKPTDEVRARHILIKVDANAKPEDVAKAEDQAKDIIKQLKGGADFAKLAMEKSDDKGSAKQGGDLGYFQHDAMVKAFADAAFSMKVGEVSSEPVKTEFGYHIIKVEDKRKSSPPPLAEVKDQIANQLGQELTDDEVKSLEANAKIEKFDINGQPLATATDKK